MKERQQAHVGRWGRSEGSWGTWRLCIYKEATPPLQDPSDSSLDFSPPPAQNLWKVRRDVSALVCTSLDCQL